MDTTEDDHVDEDGLRTSDEENSEDSKSEIQESQKEDPERVDEMSKLVPRYQVWVSQAIDWPNRLRRCLLLAALACILRPTNILIWICISCFALLRRETKGRMLSLPWEGAQVWVLITSLSLLPATRRERMALLREAALCGYQLH